MGRRAQPPRLSPTSLGRGEHKGRKATAEGETRVRASQLQPCRSNMCGNTAMAGLGAIGGIVVGGIGTRMPVECNTAQNTQNTQNTHNTHCTTAAQSTINH